jgi:catechol 2,3-dioxygenase-like lactoylglutathione lyase family enzyme
MPSTRSDEMSFKDSSILPVLAVDDLERAKAFYSDKLGFRVREDESMPGGAVVEVGSSSYIFLYTTEFKRGENTVASFLVADVRETVRELRGRGVTFEEYDLPGLKSEDGVVTISEGNEGAFFKDSEGNTIAISTDFTEALRKAA